MYKKVVVVVVASRMLILFQDSKLSFPLILHLVKFVTQQIAGLAQSVERETLSRHGISRLRVRPPRSAFLFA
ncbi:hypothetical protein BDV27DRAFT_4965 [Aspergillus caelatus]|uniref:Uncharacterized protein n=1 Tax=Aspergillus caelatus TaxID=61420 RepID=A0A5N7A1I1_9EURO|nr:uncharacterized protein BDV27DRAFT_4965 [Aspergillus caelatus]KAE8363662.1 hypothetical protein BDV27DRAFT_4965 [Aspergillus caelatus]